MLLLGKGHRDAQTFVPKELSESSLPPARLSTSMADSPKLFPKKLLKKGNLLDGSGLGGGGGSDPSVTDMSLSI